MEYSKKELELFDYFGYRYMVGSISTPAPVIYRVCVEKAFVDNMAGPAVESLRRCYKALMKCNPYRMTPEWDELIQF